MSKVEHTYLPPKNVVKRVPLEDTSPRVLPEECPPKNTWYPRRVQNSVHGKYPEQNVPKFEF